MVEVREGGMAGVAGNDGGKRASSAISGSVLFHLCQPKNLLYDGIVFIVLSRTSHVTKIDICFSPKHPAKRKIWLGLAHTIDFLGRDRPTLMHIALG